MNLKILDHPQILSAIFHPRPDTTAGQAPHDPRVKDLRVDVQDGVRLHIRCHCLAPNGVDLLFFHGNGEIVADYDEIAPLFAVSTSVSRITAATAVQAESRVSRA